MDREKIDTWCERVVLGLVLAIVAWAPLATGAVRPQDFIVVQWLTLLVLAFWGVRFIVNPKHRLLWPWVCWTVLAFMIYAVVRYLSADIEYVARQEMIKVLIYGFLFLAIIHNLYRTDTVQIMGFSLLGLGTLIAMYAVIQFLTGSEYVWHFLRPEIYRERGSGTFINPNNCAAFLAMLLPLGLAYTLAGRLGYIGKILIGYASFVIFTGVAVTFSRWGWLAAGISLVVLFGWLLGNRDYLLQSLLTIATFLAIVVVVNIIAQPAKGRPGRLTQAAKFEDVRFKVWGPAVDIWQAHPWIGAGPGHFDSRFRQYRPADEALQVRPERVHNDYLNLLADWGIVGGVLAAAVFGVFYVEIFRSWKYLKRAQNDLTTKRSNKTAFVLGGALGIAAMLLHSIFDFNFHIPANAILAVTLMALVSSHFRFATESYWHTVRWPLRIPVAVVLLAGLFYLGQQTWLHTAEIGALSQAGSAEPSTRLESLRKAAAAEPQNGETAYNLGETLRLQSWEGGDDYKSLATEALPWFEKAMQLNAYDPYSRLRYGMCLHWVGRHDEAGKYFEEALKLDPNGYYTVAHMGWHFVQLKNWEKAKEWFEKSLALNPKNNPIATSYLELVQRKLDHPETEAAQN